MALVKLKSLYTFWFTVTALEQFLWRGLRLLSHASDECARVARGWAECERARPDRRAAGCGLRGWTRREAVLCAPAESGSSQRTRPPPPEIDTPRSPQHATRARPRHPRAPRTPPHNTHATTLRFFSFHLSLERNAPSNFDKVH